MRLWAGNRNFCKRGSHRRLNALLILDGGKVDRKGWVPPTRPMPMPNTSLGQSLTLKEDGKAFLWVAWASSMEGDFCSQIPKRTPPHCSHSRTFVWARIYRFPTSKPGQEVTAGQKGDTDPPVGRFVSLTTPQLVARGTDLISFLSLPTLPAPYFVPSFCRCKRTTSNIKLPK